MTTDADLLKQGIAALNVGQKEKAYSLLMQVLERDKRNEMAWLWLSGAVDTDEDRRICLENVLAINPNNGIAQQGLEALRKSSSGLGLSSDVATRKHEALLRLVEETKAGIWSQPMNGGEETTTDEVNVILQQAVAAIKSGEKEIGKRLLVEIIELDENNKVAWLWMTRCVTDRSVRRECFERVLEIDPNNELAQKGLRQLDTLGKAKSSPTIAPRAKRSRKISRKGVVVVLCILIAVGCCVISAIGSTQPPGPDVGGGTMAYIMCQDFIEDRLVAPTTAKWPSSSEIRIARFNEREDEAYRVTGHVDAQNRMGAMIRTYYVCEIAYLGDDQWRLEYLDIIE
jgi:hypothetical protein